MTREHRVSRRVLLGAACAVPVLSAVDGPLARHPGLDPGSTFLSRHPQDRGIPGRARNDENRKQRANLAVTNWDQNLALLRRAEARLTALAHEPDEDLYDNANAVFFHALKKLVRTPAPDLPALALKVELAVDHEVAELTGGQACLAALKRDARRLCGSA